MTSRDDGRGYLYVNPRASKEDKEFYEKHFSDVTVRVSAVCMQE
jgi:hypothetical protein